MANNETHKNNRIISFDKLTDELKEQFAEVYPQPEGYEPYLKKIIKPDGTPIFVVPFETEDTVYMVKFEVKIDSPMAEDELEKDLFGENTKGSEMSDMDMIEQNESGEKDESHREYTLNHGNYAEEAAIADATSDNAFSSDDEEEDDEIDNDLLDDEEDEDDDDELEPDEKDLLDIELAMMESEDFEKTEKKEKKTAAKTTKKEAKTTEKTAAKAKKESKTAAKTVKPSKADKPKATKEPAKKAKKDSKKA